MTKSEAIAELVRIWHSPHLDLSLKAGLGEAIDALNGEDGDLISRQDALKPFCVTPDGTRIPEVDCDNFPVEFSVESIKKHLLSLPSAEPKTDEESELRFYYVESIDDYWIGQRLDNFYYADWHDGLGFVWSKSRYLPWGEHIVDENTMWKEHTYPSEPIEIPFTEWINGFVKKYFAEQKTGEWVEVEVFPEVYDIEGVKSWGSEMQCDQCGFRFTAIEGHITQYNYCPNCGARMLGEDGEA